MKSDDDINPMVNRGRQRMMTIHPMPPYDFSLSCAVFSGGDHLVRSFRDGAFRQVVDLGGRLALATATAHGPPSRPRIAIELRSDRPLSARDREQALGILSGLFNSELRLGPFYDHVKRDSVMSRLGRLLFGLKPPRTPTVFEALVDTIIEQQISLKAARVLEERLVRSFGSRLKLGDGDHFIYPLPRQLARAPTEGLRRCGLTARKADYIRGVSRKIVDGGLDLEGMVRSDNGQIIERLTQVRGIGVWTAELTMVRGLGRLDAIPADDLGVRRAISTYYRKKRRVTSQEARKMADGWGAWKGLASFYLLTAERLGIAEK